MKSEIDPASTIVVAPRKISPELPDAVSPRLVVFFAGPTARDRPSADLLAALPDTTLFRTDERGTVLVLPAARGPES